MKTWQYVLLFTGLIVMGLFMVHLDNEAETVKLRLDKCEADILQWSKLAEYAEEFHAVPDPTAPIDSTLYAIYADTDGHYISSRKVKGGRWITEHLACGDSLGTFIPDPPSFSAVDEDSGYPGKYDIGTPAVVWSKATADSSTLKISQDFRTMWFCNEIGETSTYRMKDGKWILQADTLKIAAKIKM